MKKILFNQRFVEIVLIIVTGTLMSTPFQILGIQASILLFSCFVILFGQYILFEKFDKKYKFISKTYLGILFFIPLISAIRSNIVFGQSIINGLTSHLNYYMYLSSIFFYYYIKIKDPDLNKLKKSVIALGWISFVILFIIKILFQDLRITIPSYDGITEYTYSVNNISSPFIIWVGFYYLGKYKVTSNTKNLFYFLLFISFTIIFYNARTFSAMLLIILSIFYFKEINRKTDRFKIGIFILICTLCFIFLSVINPLIYEFFENKILLFTDAANVFKGNEVSDFSANARLLQSDLAFSFLKNNFLFGVGQLKASIKEYYLSEYFYPSDIGLLGVLFNYGLIGLLILSFQIKIFYNAFKSNFIRNNSFLLGTSYFLFFKYLSSIFTGEFVFGIGFTFLLLSIIVYGEIVCRKQQEDGSCIS